MNILDVKNTISFDDSITSLQHHSYNPYTTSFNNGDEIHISIQQQDLYLLPSDSYIYIEGSIRTIHLPEAASEAQSKVPNIVNNVVAFLFDDIRYEINGFEVDRCKNPGITSTIKGLVSYTNNDMFLMGNAGWNMKLPENEKSADPRTFNYCLPLKNIFGFAEDYKHIVMNAKHEIILLRSRHQTNAFVGDNDISRFTINKIQWRIPHVCVSDTEKLKLLKIIDRKQSIQMNYRAWELHEYPTLPMSDRHIWSVKTSQIVNTPRFVIIAFQTDKNNDITADKSSFNHCKIVDMKVFLNSDCYPYECIDSDFNNDKYGVLYNMYARFKEKYYFDLADNSPLLNYKEFKEYPLIVIDCSRQSESIKRGSVDVRIEFQAKENVPNNTSAYCLILHDNIITYNPCTNIINKTI